MFIKETKMKIIQFDRKTCRMLGDAVENALQKVAEEYGVSIKRKGGSFMPTNYTIKLEASIIGQGGVVLSREAENFKHYCQIYNLEPSDLDKTFTAENGVGYKIKGLSTRSSKCPIIAESLKNGKTYKLPERMVQRGLGRTIKKEVPQWNPLSSIRPTK